MIYIEIVERYGDVAPELNPLGLSAQYPRNCREHTEIPEGVQVYTQEEFAALKETFRAEYEEKLAAWIAANTPAPQPEE